MLKKSLSILTIIAMLIATIAMPAFAADVTVGIDVDGNPAAVGDIFTADVYITGLDTLRVAQFTVGYDPAIIQATRSNGNPASNGGHPRVSDITNLYDDEEELPFFLSQVETLDSEKGLLNYAYTINQNLDAAYGAEQVYPIEDSSEKFVVLSLRFKVLAEGDTGLRIATSADGAGKYTEANPKGYILWPTADEADIVASATIVQPNLVIGGGEEPEPDTYKVIYNVDGDVASIVDDNEYEEDDEVTVTTQVPSREGYNFLGWSRTSGAAAADYVGGNTFTMGAEDVTLYAVWQKKVYTVTFIADGNPVATLNVEHGGSVDHADIPQVPAKAGFTGVWEEADLTNITENITVVAVYTEVPDGIYVEVDNATIVQGSTGKVDIKFVDLPESAQGVEFEVSYDTNVFTSVTATVNSKFTAEQYTPDGVIKIAALLKENETFDAEQVVATLNLTVALEAPIGETTIQLQEVKYGVEGGSGDAIAIDDVIGGKVTVEQQADPNLEAAIEAVEAYEAAPIDTLADIEEAEALEEAARDAVALVQDGSAKDELIARIEAKKALVDAAKVALAKEEALARVNSLNFTYADLQTLEISDAVEANMNSYKLAVSIAQGKKGANLTAEEVAVAVAAANTELSNVANDPSKAGNVYDGAFDIQDAVGVKNHILGKEDFTIAQAIRADMNKDGVINAVDLTEILVNIAKLGD